VVLVIMVTMLTLFVKSVSQIVRNVQLAPTAKHARVVTSQNKMVIQSGFVKHV
jgi:hypothetical protein